MVFRAANCMEDGSVTSLMFLLEISKNSVGILLDTSLIRTIMPIASGRALCSLLLMVVS